MPEIEINSVKIGDYIGDAIPRLRTALEHAVANEEKLKEILKEQEGETEKIRRALTVFDPEFRPKATSKKKATTTARPKPGQTGFGISLEAAAPIAEAILDLHGEGLNGVTQTDILKRLPDTNPAMVSAAFKFLRNIEFVRKTGRHNNRDMYQVMDRGAFDRVRRESAQAAGDVAVASE